MAEHLICNQAVDGSTPFTSSNNGGFPERPKGADCKSVVTDFGGPNPPSPTKRKALAIASAFSFGREIGGEVADARTERIAPLLSAKGFLPRTEPCGQ